MADELKKILDSLGSPSIAYNTNDILESLIKTNPDIRAAFDQETLLSISSPEFSKYEVGISGAEYLVARTGSIFLNSQMAGGRRLSVLPPIHIVLAWRNQLVPSLDDVLKSISNRDTDWSYATFITGPSRTSDIEKKLVLGAHGPKRLITLILDT
jgi:L-lactate dehydrogenase complex protein LldG